MSCKQIINKDGVIMGFSCSINFPEIPMSKEDKENLEYWKREFIEYMMKKFFIDKDHAVQECEAYVESVGISDLSCFDDAVMECVDAWSE